MAPDRLSHVDGGGEARMVDVSGKEATRRRAVAEAVVEVGPAVAAAIAVVAFLFLMLLCSPCAIRCRWSTWRWTSR